VVGAELFLVRRRVGAAPLAHGVRNVFARIRGLRRATHCIQLVDFRGSIEVFRWLRQW
jgi:hypothetical protein